MSVRFAAIITLTTSFSYFLFDPSQRGGARHVLLLGGAALLLELAVMSWMLRRQLTRPLLALTQAAEQVAAGNSHVGLDTSRGDELGRLAGAIRTMAGEVQRREEALREAHAGWERRSEERARELKEAQQKLMETARQAGMAEIATNVLHNVGNVLNSVHTSASLAKDRLARLRLEHVGRVAALLQERQDDLAVFLCQEERGRSVMPYLGELGRHLVEGRQEIASLLEDVDRYTDHIGNIVRLQQSYARTPRMDEPARLEELVEDALRIQGEALTHHGVLVVRKLAPVPPLLIDRHKVLTILINLVSNARNALEARSEGERLLTLRLDPPLEGRIRVEVRDNGMGIAPEMLTRIFQYGFTTRDEGHGFGLHSCAVTAQQLGGSLQVHSDGPGHGATFTLELPYQPAKDMT